jgi:catechol 2,3-dioxygenase-like lactoylglutathione lyase family enzyme
MKLVFLYHPVKDLKAALGFYRDVLGWDEAWREGDETVAMSIPDSDVQVMLDVSDSSSAEASGFFQVPDVDAFYERNRDHVDFVELPRDLPPIRCASFTDPSGHLFRIFHELESDAQGA